MNAGTVNHRSRAEDVTACVGPVGHLFRSLAAARLLNLLVDRPDEYFRFTELEKCVGVAKRSLQVSLESLTKAGLIVHEGHTYCFAVQSPLARPISDAIKVSRRESGLPRTESFADSVARCTSAPADSYTVDGPTVEHPTPEAERVAHMKRLPDTPLQRWTSSEPTGAFAI